jgi:SAM-dependent methyltransferase
MRLSLRAVLVNVTASVFCLLAYPAAAQTPAREQGRTPPPTLPTAPTRGPESGGVAASAQGVGTSQEKKERAPDVVFVPTPQAVVDKMLELAEVKKGDLLYDLGCGDGRIVVTAAKKHGARAVGIDIDPQRIKESRQNVRDSGVADRVTIKQGDIFEEDLGGATVVTLYLLPDLNVKLMPRLRRLKPGTRIVSHDFDMRGAKPKKVVNVQAGDEENEHTVYLWVVPWEDEK